MLKAVDPDVREEGEAMTEPTDGGSRYVGPERREEQKPSAWADPRTWMTLCGLLLAFLGYVSTQLSSINGGIQALRETSAAQRVEIKQLQDDVRELKADNKTQEQINRMNDRQWAEIKAGTERPPKEHP